MAQQNKELEQANRITDELATAEENYAAKVQKLEKLLNKGYITQETYNRGVDKAAKTLPATTAALERQAQAQKKRDAELARASQITAAAATNEEKYAQETKELEQFLAKGLITQTTFNRSLDAAKKNPKSNQNGSKIDSKCCQNRLRTDSEAGQGQVGIGLSDIAESK